MVVVGCHKNVLITLCGLLLLFFGNVVGQDFKTTTPYRWHSNGDVRLVGGSSPSEGRVEVYYSGHWNTVCDDSWDYRDAAVVCTQLGLVGNAVALRHAYFGSGDGDILLDELDCFGWEWRLLQCLKNDLYEHDCTHEEDAGVRCDHTDVYATPSYWWHNDGDVRLVGGSSPKEGRVEVYYDGKWNTLCGSSSFSFRTAAVICTQLGYDGFALEIRNAYFGAGEGAILSFDCFGWESTLLECSNDFSRHYCTHEEDAGVRCKHAVEGSVRLSNGYSESSGRVEIYYEGEWGTICEDNWSFNDAIVICRQLGYELVDDYTSKAYYSRRESGPIMLDLGCSGNEWSWQDCSHQNWRTENCSHYEDVSVSCSSRDFHATTPNYYHSDGDVRLVGGSSPHEGRVEVYYNEHWNTVCDDSWDSRDATVVCKQLGYERSAEVFKNSYFGGGDGDILFNNVACAGWESSLLQCSSNEFYEHDCSHRAVAGVKCEHADFYATTPNYYQSDGDVRLVGGSSPHEGRVEVYYNGHWYTVCDDSWDYRDATVVCQQLGYEGSAEAFNDAYFGAGDGDILIDDVECFGWESTLLKCRINNWILHDCTNEDVGVKCEHADTSMNSGAIAAIMIASVFVFVCICVGSLLTYRYSKQYRARTQPCTQPRIAVLSARTNVSGPSAFQPNNSDIVALPTYNDAVNNPVYRGQHVEPFQLEQAGMQSCFPQINQGTATAGYPVSMNAEFIHPYPVHNSPGYTQPPPYPVHSSHNPPFFKAQVNIPS